MKNRALFILLSFLMVFTLPSTAQQSIIRGIIKGHGGEPLSYPTVVLLQTDSIYVNTVIADSLGRFSFNEHLSSYRLIVQHLLYETSIVDVDNDQPVVVEMQFKDNQINEAVAIGNRPLVNIKDGALVYDIRQVTKDRVVTSVYDAILGLPGVHEEGGRISLAGAIGVTIIIDGRPTSMTPSQLIELLRQIPVSYIESAEIMYSTPPKYNVRGAAINLIMKSGKSEIVGTSAEVNLNYDQKFYSNFSGGVSLVHSTDKFSADVLYSLSNLRRRSTMELFSHHSLFGSVHDIEQFNYGKNEKQLHLGRVSLDYKIAGNDRLSLVYTTTISENAKAKERSRGNFSNSLNQNEGNDQMHNVALDYNLNFGLNVGLSYTFFESSFSQDFTDTDNGGNSTSFISQERQSVNKYMLYINQTHSSGNQWNLNYGIKGIYASDHDSQYYQITEGNIDLHDTDNTIKEYVFDLHAGASKSINKKLSFNFSLTGEYYKLSNYSEWSLFPQVGLTYVHSTANIFQFGLSSNKQYPSYWTKQDYVGYFNGYAQVMGNPLLKAYNIHSTQLSYIRNRKYIFTLYYTFMPNYAEQLAYQSSQDLNLVYKTLNWDFMQMLGVNVVVPFKIRKIMESKLVLNGYYQQAKNESFFDISFNNRKLVGRFSLDSGINLSSKPDIKAEFSAFYMTGPAQGIYDLSNIWGVDAGIKWSFAKQKADLILKTTDIFESSTPNISVNKSGQNLKMYLMEDARQVKMSFIYRFGGYKAKERGEVDQSRFGH